MLVIDADEVDLSAGGQVNDSSGGSAGDDEGRVDLLILQALSAVAEALVLGVDIVKGHAVCAENVNGVEVNTGALSTDRDALALEVGNGLDVGVHGDDLYLLFVERGGDGEAADSAGISEEVGAVIGVAHNVGLAEAELYIAGVEVFDVCLGAVAGDGGDAQVAVIGNVLGKHAAESIIGARFTAGGESERFLLCAAVSCRSAAVGRSRGGIAAGAQREYHNKCKQKCDNFFHTGTS